MNSTNSIFIDLSGDLFMQAYCHCGEPLDSLTDAACADCKSSPFTRCYCGNPSASLIDIACLDCKYSPFPRKRTILECYAEVFRAQSYNNRPVRRSIIRLKKSFVKKARKSCK